MKKLTSILIASLLLLVCILFPVSCTLVIPGLVGTPSGDGSGEKTEEEKDKETDEDTKEDDGKIEVNWQRGYIGSRWDKEGFGKVNTDNNQYVYTDVIEMGVKGTKITFTEYLGLEDTEEALLLSSWSSTADGWEINPDGINLDVTTKLLRKKQGGATTYTYVSTKDNECVRFCFRVGLLDTPTPDVYLSDTTEPGTAANLFYIKEWTDMDSERAYFSSLEGKKISFIGDSLFGGHGIQPEEVWCALLAEKYGMAYCNYGINGCTLSACEGGKNPIVSRYTQMADNDPDIIVIEGGRNDYNKCAVLGGKNSKDISTYRGAIRSLVEGLSEKYPDALIVAVTFWNANDRKNDDGRTCNEYTDAMKEVCADMGVPVINAADEEASGIKMTDSAFRAAYSVNSTDVCHLNAAGMRLALPFFERELAEIIEKNK